MHFDPLRWLKRLKSTTHAQYETKGASVPEFVRAPGILCEIQDEIGIDVGAVANSWNARRR